MVSPAVRLKWVAVQCWCLAEHAGTCLRPRYAHVKEEGVVDRLLARPSVKAAYMRPDLQLSVLDDMTLMCVT
jgi:hypothetical protein